VEGEKVAYLPVILRGQIHNGTADARRIWLRLARVERVLKWKPESGTGEEKRANFVCYNRRVAVFGAIV
jgi:hypothetical protein